MGLEINVEMSFLRCRYKRRTLVVNNHAKCPAVRIAVS